MYTMHTHTHIHTHSQAVHFHCDGVSLTINTNTSIAYHLRLTILESVARLVLGLSYHYAFLLFSPFHIILFSRRIKWFHVDILGICT